jgi:AcrR family transcriptional regulator
MTATVELRAKGRPRDCRIDDAVVDAAVATLAAVGFGGFSVEEVASRAGVAKTSVYRRFAGRDALLAAALQRLNDEMPPLPAPGPVRERLRAALDAVRASCSTSRGPILDHANASGDPQVMHLVHDLVLEPRRRILVQIIEEGVASGELRADLDTHAAVACLVGPMLVLRTWGKVGRELDQPVDTILELVLEGIGA